jgi:hypothetical protein
MSQQSLLPNPGIGIGSGASIATKSFSSIADDPDASHGTAFGQLIDMPV